MPNPLAVMPDDELAVIQYLRTITEVAALVTVGNIRTELPAQPVYPYVLIQRAAGQAAVEQAIDLPAVQIDVVGGSKAACKKLMLTVRAAVLAIANDTVPEAVLASAYEEVGPSWLPDNVPVPPIPRYVARFRVYLHK